MSTTASFWVTVFLIFLLNLPFGFWRAGTRKLSRNWFVAVHAPVPFAIGLRLLMGLGLRLKLLPVFVASYFAGQLVGGRARQRGKARALAEEQHLPGRGTQ